MKKFIVPLSLTTSLSTFLVRPVMAGNISFDSLPASWNGTVNNQIESDFIISGSSSYWIGDGANFCSPQCPENGTHYLLSQWGSTIGLGLVSSGEFSVTSFDYAEQYMGFSYVPRIDVTGYLLNGGVATASFLFDGVNDGLGPLYDFQTAMLPNNFSNLIRIEFSVPGNGNFSLDNIQASPVPEPTIDALLAVSAFILAGRRLLNFYRHSNLTKAGAVS